MTSCIIKSADTEALQAVTPIGGSAAVRSDADSTPAQEVQEIHTLRAELARLQALCDQHPRALEDAARAAAETARAEAIEDFEDRETDRLDALKAALLEAHREIAKSLSEVDRLALALAGTALEQIFVPTDDYKDLMARAISRGLNDLERGLVLHIYVSPQDFPNNQALKALSDQLQLAGLEVTTSPDLTAGDCRFDLKLGAFEFSIPTYWADLSALFETLSDQGERP